MSQTTTEPQTTLEVSATAVAAAVAAIQAVYSSIPPAMAQTAVLQLVKQAHLVTMQQSLTVTMGT